MQIQAMQLNDNVKPLLNNTHINTVSPQHRDYTLTLDDRGQFLKVEHKSKGTFLVPIHQISWMRPAAVKAPKIPTKRKPVKSVTRS
mgnify:CR=1 FL=1